MKLNKSQWMLFLLFLILGGILIAVLPSCTHYVNPEKCPPHPSKPGKIHQKLPKPPVTGKPVKQ